MEERKLANQKRRSEFVQAVLLTWENVRGRLSLRGKRQQNSENRWRTALDLTPLSSHFMHWDTFQNYLTHFLRRKTCRCLPPGLQRERSQALSLIPRGELRWSSRRASCLQVEAAVVNNKPRRGTCNTAKAVLPQTAQVTGTLLQWCLMMGK